MNVRVRVAAGVLLVVLMAAGGCRTYQVTQSDFYSAQSLGPKPYHSAAVIMHDKSDKNRLFLEAFNVELMKRGLEVVEREKFEKLVQEQLLVRGEMTNLSDREKAIRVGKLLKVDIVFYADALVNNTRYTYDPPPIGSDKRAMMLQDKANQTGVVEGVGDYTIHAYHDIGVTTRAIDSATGEIVWVGYRMLSVCEQVTTKSATSLTNFATIKKLSGMVLEDFFSGSKKATTKAS